MENFDCNLEKILKLKINKVVFVKSLDKVKKDKSLEEIYHYIEDKKEKPKIICGNGLLLIILRDFKLSKLNFSYKSFFILYKENNIYTNLEIEKDYFKKNEITNLKDFLERVGGYLISKFEDHISYLQERFEKIMVKNKEEVKLDDIDEILKFLNIIDIFLAILKEDLEVFEKLKIKKVSEELKELYEDLSFLDSKLDNLLQIYSIYYNLKTSKILDKISIIAFLFLIPSTIFGMYGMNFKYIPFSDHPYGFVIVSVVSFLIVGILYWFLIKKLST